MSVDLFNAKFYRAANHDLAGLNDTAARSHFQTYGLNEGRAFSPLVDLNFYRASSSDLSSFSYRQAFEHLQNHGVREGRRFSQFVDLNFYRLNNRDLAGFNNEQSFAHLQNHGVGEGRRFSQFVDLNFYRASNRDLAGFNNEQILEHLQNYGVREGRRFSQFVDLDFYRRVNADLASFNSLQLLEHFGNYGLSEGRSFSVAFNVNFYRNTYADLAALGNQQLYQHFQLNGLNEGRRSSASFNIQFYRANNSDLSGMNNQQAYNHFVLYGQQEGRAGALPDLQWNRNFGYLTARSVATDSAGNAYVLGESNYNAVLIRYDSTGRQVWTQILSSSDSISTSGIAIDNANNIYITGETYGVVSGQTSAGRSDYWLAKYDISGSRQWVRQFGTARSDYSRNVAVDTSGNVYLTGYTSYSSSDDDGWVVKLDSNGTQQWRRALETSTSYSSITNGVAVDSSGNVYVTGYTNTSLVSGQSNAGLQDAYVASYTSNGTQRWVRQFGSSSNDYSSAMAIDSSGNLYIAGDTYGSLQGTNVGSADAWLARYDSSGNRIWLQQFGTSRSEETTSLTVDRTGNVYLSGFSRNSGSTPNDPWVTKYKSNGSRLWFLTTNFGEDVAVNGIGDIYVVGTEVNKYSQN